MMTFLQVTGLQTSARAGPLRAYAPVCGQGRQTGRAWGRPSYTATSGVQPHGVCVQRDRVGQREMENVEKEERGKGDKAYVVKMLEFGESERRL